MAFLQRRSARDAALRQSELLVMATALLPVWFGLLLPATCMAAQAVPQPGSDALAWSEMHTTSNVTNRRIAAYARESTELRTRATAETDVVLRSAGRSLHHLSHTQGCACSHPRHLPAEHNIPLTARKLQTEKPPRPVESSESALQQ